MASYLFSEIKLEHECDPDRPVGNFISLFDSIMTLVFLPDYFHILESTLNPVPVHHEIESPISYNHTLLMGKACEHQYFDLDPILK